MENYKEYLEELRQLSKKLDEYGYTEDCSHKITNRVGLSKIDQVADSAIGNQDVREKGDENMKKNDNIDRIIQLMKKHNEQQRQ